jgi:hypothetical protein
MPSCKTSLTAQFRLTKLTSALVLLTACSTSFAGEGGFIGLYGGTTVSNSADKTSNSFKILTGAHITSQLSLELGYLNMGKTSYNDPKAINQEATNRNNISFSDAGHGSIGFGQLGDPTVVVDGPNTYNDKGDSTFTGVSTFVPEGALINLSYSFPLVDNSLDFFVKTGFYAWWADYKTIELTASQTPGVSKITEKEHQTSAVNTISGAGLIYYPIQQLSIRAEVETTAIASGVMPRTRLQNIAIGVNWEF